MFIVLLWSLFVLLSSGSPKESIANLAQSALISFLIFVTSFHIVGQKEASAH